MTQISNTPKVVNGDTVIGFTTTKKIKELGWMDMASMSSWYEEAPDRNHLGLIDLFSTHADYRMPTLKNFFKEGAVINVNGADGKFTYDLPVIAKTGCTTMEDTSQYNEALGIDGTVFPIVLSEPFTVGDILTYDAAYGDQVIVSEDYPVEKHGDTWKHWVTMVNQHDAGAYFEAQYLKKGVQYFKIGHSLGEFSEKYSNLQSPDTVSSLKCEFQLGNHRGVETFYTQYADMKRMGAAAIQTKEYWGQYENKMKRLGTDANGKPLDMYFVGKLDKTTGKMKKNSMRIGGSLEYLVILELLKLESFSLYFQKAGFINDINGTKRLNEGIWHQIRRGEIIEYARAGGITKSHIKRATAFLFQSRTDQMPHQRRVMFKCGHMAYINMLNIFRDEAMAQLEGLAQFLGTDSVLPTSPVKGKSLTSLELEPLTFTKVNIPEIGIVEIKHDPFLDYQPLADRRSAGFVGDGYARTSYSMVIWDAADDEYSNAMTGLPAGAKLAEGSKNTANIYYVKPEGVSMWWGYENGRYSPDTARDIASSMKKMGREFWAQNFSAAWVRDKSRYITIELQH